MLQLHSALCVLCVLNAHYNSDGGEDLQERFERESDKLSNMLQQRTGDGASRTTATGRPRAIL